MRRILVELGCVWVICACFFLVGLFLLADGARKVGTWQLATGKVVGFESYRNSTLTVAKARVKFPLPDGKMIFFVSNGDHSKYPDGTVVPVRYNPERPSEAEIDSFDTLFTGPALLLGISIVLPLTLIGLRVALDRRKQWLPPPTTGYRPPES